MTKSIQLILVVMLLLSSQPTDANAGFGGFAGGVAVELGFRAYDAIRWGFAALRLCLSVFSNHLGVSAAITRPWRTRLLEQIEPRSVCLPVATNGCGDGLQRNLAEARAERSFQDASQRADLQAAD